MKPCPACGSEMEVHALGSANCLNRQILAMRLVEHDLRAEVALAKEGLSRFRVMYQADTEHLQKQIEVLRSVIPKEEKKERRRK